MFSIYPFSKTIYSMQDMLWFNSRLKVYQKRIGIPSGMIYSDKKGECFYAKKELSSVSDRK